MPDKKTPEELLADYRAASRDAADAYDTVYEDALDTAIDAAEAYVAAFDAQENSMPDKTREELMATYDAAHAAHVARIAYLNARKAQENSND